MDRCQGQSILPSIRELGLGFGWAFFPPFSFHEVILNHWLPQCLTATDNSQFQLLKEQSSTTDWCWGVVIQRCLNGLLHFCRKCCKYVAKMLHLTKCPEEGEAHWVPSWVGCTLAYSSEPRSCRCLYPICA